MALPCPMPRLAAIALAAIAVAAGPAGAQKAGGVLKAYHRDNPPSASIHEEATISTAQPFSAVFNNLLIFDQHVKTNSLDHLQAELATAWAWSEDMTKLTFQLREGVRWHDGKPFTAEDVKCTWDTVSGKRDAGWRKNPREPWYFNLEEITTNGRYEVAFHLKRPQPSFLAFLAGGFSPVYPCHVDGREMRSKPIGTGPFKVAEFRQNEHIRLVRNDDYWKPDRPYLDGVEWRIIQARSTRVLAFIAGEFDLTFSQDVSIPLLRDVQANAPKAYCELNASNVHGNLLVNREAPPFDDPRIRRAMVLAIDRPAFITVLSEGRDKIGGAMLPAPAGVWGAPAEYFDPVPGYGPDIAGNRAEGR
ncbi:MAG: ABC transporter substrate-binding protein, partial [Alphaproteobacteria bacterium]